MCRCLSNQISPLYTHFTQNWFNKHWVQSWIRAMNILETDQWTIKSAIPHNEFFSFHCRGGVSPQDKQ